MLESTRIFKIYRIRRQLIVHPWLSERLRGGHILVQHVPKMLRHFSDDAGAACTGVRDVDGAIGKFNDGGGDGREGTLEGLDKVCLGWDVAECVGCVGDTEVLKKLAN